MISKEVVVYISYTVELGLNPTSPKYTTKSTTVESRQYFTHGRNENPQSEDLIAYSFYI